jgi:uncharacterized protein (DUF1697 family)
MGEFAVFLRGVNVAGITIRMADLRDALSGLAITGVKTLLASGNAVLTSDLSREELKAQVEDALRRAFGYDAWVVVLTRTEVESLVRDCPYPPDNADVHSYITLSSSPDALDELWEATSEAGTERTRLAPYATAWLSPKGATLVSAMSKATARPRFKAATTTRNLRTLIKVRDAFA